MYHRLEKHNHFNIPSNIFLENPNYLLYFSHGNYLRDGRIGPHSGFATGSSKKNTLIRTIAEGIERRATMLGGGSKSDDVMTWDILNQRINKLNFENTTFKDYEIDTTGSAVHTSQDKAIYGAIKELYEKNSLFLFWYGKVGHKIILDEYVENPYYEFFRNSGYEVSVFVNEYFSPLKTVIAIAYKSDHSFFCGLGTSNSYEDAVIHALEEVFLIASFYFYKNILQNDSGESFILDQPTESHIHELNKLTYKEINDSRTESISLKDLVSLAPDYVESINVILIQQNLVTNLVCIKVYIEGLFNCLPKKKNITEKLLINENTIKITPEKLALLPECPMS
ncbi:hypothetical protein ADM98_00775 [Exiguobacterium sp. BMC-KP]|uniref:YcaO-like family protein n=1 Tax=Exiguobacterium sp. BMC-KP TaxID=1684312 RepID=UPI0006AA3DA9|nr:YcaO-like family protein [Exiguobacterium sp. BMC-KP]KOP31414.1 hypothetical protein ADM98_00775 [Exiguobacterium sp. BMC-KP]